MGFAGEGGFSHLPDGYIIGNRYRIIKPLGSGGMASVYLAADEMLCEASVAVKVLRTQRNFGKETNQRFLSEVRLTQEINDPHVVRTFAIGHDEDTLFYTMEYLPGPTLEAFMSEPEFPVGWALGIATQIMQGLAAIHSVGVIHRDLKPANIIMDGCGKLKIADFGVARGATSSFTIHSGDILGTLAYVAPEAVLGGAVTIAVDYYALGAILYQLLTQTAPIDDDLPARLLLRKVEEAPRDPRELRRDIPDWLATGLMGLLQVDPDARMRSLEDFAANLDIHAPKMSQDFRSSPMPDSVAVEEKVLNSPRSPDSLGSGPIVRYVLLAVIIGLITIPLALNDISARIELEYLDHLFRVRGPKQPRSDVTIVAVDEPDATDPPMPVAAASPRELQAKLVRTLAPYAPKRVVFDDIFDGNSSALDSDSALATAIESLPTVLGVASISSSSPSTQVPVEQRISRPSDMLAEKALGIADVTLPLSFGRVWDLPLSKSETFPEVPFLSEAASRPLLKEGRPGARSLLNHYGPTGTIPTVPYGVVVSSERPLPREVFKDKIVFVGFTQRGATERTPRRVFATPFDSVTSSTELHATATSNLLSRDWISRLPIQWEFCAQFVLTAGAVLVILLSTSSMLPVYIVGGLCGVVASHYLIFLLGLALPVVIPLMAGMLGGLLARIIFGRPLSGRTERP
jgi:serine/threonine-protein kinase